MPQVLSTVVIGIVWNWIYNPIFGILNKGLDAIGLQDVSRGWLGDPDVALYAVLAAAIWATIGFVFVIFLAGLQNVSKDLLEAATIDGANGWQRFWHVTVPQMSNVINVVTALLLIGGFNVFDIVFVMTRRRPGQRHRGHRHLHLQGSLHAEPRRLRLDPVTGDDRHLADCVGDLHPAARATRRPDDGRHRRLRTSPASTATAVQRGAPLVAPVSAAWRRPTPS